MFGASRWDRPNFARLSVSPPPVSVVIGVGDPVRAPYFL